MAFAVGLIGGCSGSSTGALSVFRVQLVFTAIRAQIQQVLSPSRTILLKYDGRSVDAETINGVMLFVTSFILLIGVMSVALTLFGVDLESALLAVWASLGNVGYGIGPMVARTGTFVDFPVAAKWVLILAMLLGRLSLIAVLLVFLPRFWRG